MYCFIMWAAMVSSEQQQVSVVKLVSSSVRVISMVLLGPFGGGLVNSLKSRYKGSASAYFSVVWSKYSLKGKI